MIDCYRVLAESRIDPRNSPMYLSTPEPSALVTFFFQRRPEPRCRILWRCWFERRL